MRSQYLTRSRCAILGIVTRLIPLLLLAASLCAQPRATVLAPVLNMYSKPTADTDVVSQAIYGTTVTIVEESEGWARIKTPDDYPGWASASLLRKLKAGDPPYADSGKVARVDNLFAHLYRENSVTKHAPLLTVPFETRLEIVEERPEDNARWLAVRLPDDRKAWVQRGDITSDSVPRTIPELIDLSRRFLGLPYTWGGTSSFGYDCSGFTQMLCRRGGRGIPRDADQQAMWDGMQKVDRKNLQPGDLLYFGKSVEKASHTGFYLGGGQFIHATTNTRPVIQISTLADEPWTTVYVAARRWKQ
jgi:gamma-D-glutamyl-L-lysine dipeptidyl-peptidase